MHRPFLVMAAILVSFTTAAAQQPDQPQPLQGRQLENVIAFAKLLGYVRYFHPSDEAAATDWNRFAIDGVSRIEAATSPDDLAKRLNDLFQPIAPRIDVRTTTNPQKWDTETAAKGTPKVVFWRHLGVGTGNPQSIYKSERIYEEPERIEFIKRIGSAPIYELGGGVSARVPLYLAVDGDNRTQPRGKMPGKFDEDHAYSANDRPVRLASVILAWNVFQHFYPYFDVIQTDWSAVLADSLHRAAIDQSPYHFLQTLKLMVAALRDGHGYAMHPTYTPAGRLPIALAWIEEQLVVTAVNAGAGDVRPGDIVLKFNGRPAAEVVLDTERYISAASPGWLHHQAVRRLVAGAITDTAKLEVTGADGKARLVELTFIAMDGFVNEPLPAKVAEVRPNIWYVDLDRATDADFTAAVEKLAAADGVIFDLRGYPSSVSTIALSHLIDEPITCARWNIPLVTLPDRTDMQFKFSNWQVPPKSPRIKAKVAFITAGSAISYAETYMGMVENYKLAEIVGAPTAGTNGNVNTIALPGGYRIGFTGMKVLKHDGSQHHMIGIRPTVPVKRTVAGVRAGKDEYLERAIEVVSHR